MNAEANNTNEKVRELQRKLYLSAKGNKKRRYHALYDKVYRIDILWKAWKQVKANGGTGVDASQTVTYDSNYTLPTPTRTGYTFGGWYCGTTPYTGGTWLTPENTTLVAKWTARTDISYVVNHYQQKAQKKYSLCLFNLFFQKEIHKNKYAKVY